MVAPRGVRSMARIVKSATSTFIVITVPAMSENKHKNSMGTSTRGFFDRINIDSAGDHNTLNNRLIVCISTPRCFFTLLCLSLQVTMRAFVLSLLLAAPAFAQDLDVAVRPDVVYVESLAGNIVPMERTFFHVVIENQAKEPMQIEWVRFDMVNSKGVLFSGQYSGSALTDLFDSAMDRRRIEPTSQHTLTLAPAERKAISDVFMDFPKGFMGENLLVEVDYKSGGAETSKKSSVQLQRTVGFSGRLPFDGTWYVAAEHSYLDPHKRFLAEAYAYDFLQIGANGKSYERDGKNNARS